MKNNVNLKSNKLRN